MVTYSLPFPSVVKNDRNKENDYDDDQTKNYVIEKEFTESIFH